MNKFIKKIKSYFYQPLSAKGEDFIVGVKTTLPEERASIRTNSMSYGERKRYFDNYNQNLLNRISDIKSRNS